MVDCVFFINHALNVNQLSVYSNEDRFQQTIETVESINKYCPDNRIFMFDSSPSIPENDKFQTLNKMGVDIFYAGQNPYVKNFSEAGLRSHAECISFILFLHWYKTERNWVQGKRICKLSGRYKLNENFNLTDDRFKDSFVFADSIESWMDKSSCERAGVDRLYKLRMWHMDYSLLELFTDQMIRIFDDCSKFSIDVEHSYYKNLHRYKTVEVEKIGVEGNIAPTGEYINE